MGAALLPDVGVARGCGGGADGEARGLLRAAATYLNKQLQALDRAGILTSTPGARGGFRLARAPERITLMDVVAAVDGPDDVFRCTEIRQRAGGASAAAPEFRRPCGIASAMRRAEMVWRRELAAQTLADLMADASVASAERTRRHFARTSR